MRSGGHDGSPAIPINYGQSVIGGVLVRQDARSVLNIAVQGRVIEITSASDYTNLYHVFERLSRSSARFAEFAIKRRQIGPSRWLVFAKPRNERLPDVEWDENYDPKRGRYKRCAERLKEGDALVFATREEAVKARRAWQHYVSLRLRAPFRCRVSRNSAGAFSVGVVPRGR